MGASFFERMSGHLVDHTGTTHAVDFDVKAETRRLNGTLRLSGVIRAGPWAEDEGAEGTLALSPRHMRYEVRFADGFTLLGRKDIDPLHPLRSMTTLHTELVHEGNTLARGELRFDLNDLPALVGSLSPTTSFQRVDLGAEPLSEHARRTLRAYTEAAIVPGERVPAVDEQTFEATEQLLGDMPPWMRTAHRQALRALDLAAVARHGRRFARLPLQRRRELVERMAASEVGAGLTLVLGIAPKTAHFSRRDYLDATGAPSWETPVREPEGSWMRQVTPAEELPEEAEFEADVVVVGTGAGGGVVAAKLAEAGLAVAILEEGRFQGRSAFQGSPNARIRRFYRDGGMVMTVGNVPISIPLGRLVGGSTAINSGTCFRTPDGILDEWRSEGVDLDLQRHLDEVEAELKVEPGDPRHLGRIADIVARGADAMGKDHGPLLRNAEGCDGQGVCTLGCPTDAKRSSNVSWIPRALRAGAELFTGLPVTRVLRRGRRTVGVEARGHDRHGAPRRLRIKARAVVLACGTLATPGLLHASGLRLPMLGRNLSIHPAMGMYGLFDQQMEPWNAIPQSYGVDDLVDDRVRFEGFYVPPPIGGALLPVEGAELTRWMDAQDRVGQFGFMVRDRGVGRVLSGPGRRPIIRYDLDAATLRRFRTGAARLAELLLQGGAREVLAGVGPVKSVRSVEEARAIEHRGLRPRDFRLLAFHPLGTCRMGVDADRGVVDTEHRVHGMQGLYVADGSSVPSSLGVNPQVTIMAMAARAAEGIAARLG